MKKMRLDVITLFPEMVESIQQYGVVGRAFSSDLAELHCHNPRDEALEDNGRIDDRPYGGGPGMVMQYQPLEATIKRLKQGSEQAKVVYLSPQGKKLDQASIRALSAHDHLIFLCGRYEGIDERLLEDMVDEEYSLGDYVISGGELAAMVVIDAIIRTLPGALGDEQSAVEDSFESGLLDYPHYTRPENVAGQQVPQVLISGDHNKIAEWRLKQALGRTYLRRPDLMAEYQMSDHEKRLLDEFLAENSSNNEK
jgi:tRNA (guanine37-N1)-methyltransferase